MGKYRNKPVVVEAIQFVGDSDSYNKIREFAKGKIDLWEGRATIPQSLMVRTLEGNMIARCGDYIIKDVNGEFYPCKLDIFEKTYEKVGNKGLTINVNIQDTDEFEKLAKGIADLIKQIEMNDYEDSLGHPLKNNKVYLDLKELIKGKKEVKRCYIKVSNSYYETKINDIDIIANLCNKNKLIALVGGEYIKGSLVEEIKNLEGEA